MSVVEVALEEVVSTDKKYVTLKDTVQCVCTVYSIANDKQYFEFDNVSGKALGSYCRYVLVHYDTVVYRAGVEGRTDSIVVIVFIAPYDSQCDVRRDIPR
jgi:hypothetical protein